MHLQIRIDPRNARRWLGDLREGLARAGHACSFVASPAESEALTAVDVLFELERLIYRLPGPRSSDRVDRALLDAGARPNAEVDLVLDCSGAPDSTRGGPARLVVLYDGIPAEAALYAGLLDGRTPRVSIVNAASGVTLAAGEPGTDNAGSVREASELVHARTITLISVALKNYLSGRRQDVPPDVKGAGTAVVPYKVARKLARSMAHAAVRRLYHLCCYAPHWQIGWRHVAGGSGAYETLSIDGARWNIVSSPPGRFFADPFPIAFAGREYIFFEDLDHRTQKGVISFVEVVADGTHGPVQRVLEEAWHLSYPFLYEDGGAIYMIPESSSNRTVELYRADPFPHRWVKEATLISGVELSDATIVRRGEKLWMFGATRDGSGSYSDTLSIFSAPRLTGPWHEHGGNPVLIDQRAARPAGNFFHREGKLWRPVQDCARGYGTGVGLAEVLRLDDNGFEQRVHTVLRTPPEWPGKRLHTLSRYGALECIDGSGHAPKYAVVGALLR